MQFLGKLYIPKQLFKKWIHSLMKNREAGRKATCPAICLFGLTGQYFDLCNPKDQRFFQNAGEDTSNNSPMSRRCVRIHQQIENVVFQGVILCNSE